MNQSGANKLDLSSLDKAIFTLEEAISEFAKDNNNTFVRDACIQRFEYTYELFGKMLRRFLSLTEMNLDEIITMSFPNLIRTASTRKLLKNNWEKWSIYRNARNITSHTYDEKQAKKIIAILPDFLSDAKFLYQALVNKLN